MFDASSAPNLSRIKPQRLFSESVKILKNYPYGKSGDLEKKSMVCLSWLLCDRPLDTETERTIDVFVHLMSATILSPLRRMLLEYGYGDIYIEVDFHLFQPLLSILVMNVSRKDISKVELLVTRTLVLFAEKGFNTDAVEASVNTMEFICREYNEKVFPEGLSLMLQSIDKWIYGMDPFEALKHGNFLMELNARIQKEGSKTVFSPLIKKFILNNPHKVVVAMQPDPQKFSGDKKAEKEILGKVKAGMTENDLAELVRATRELRLKQKNPDPPEALRSVPILCLQEIPKPKHVPPKIHHVLQDVQFTDKMRFKETVSQFIAEYQNSDNHHEIAAVRGDAKLNVFWWIREQFFGISQLEFLEALEGKVDQDWDGISSSLEEIRKSVICKKGCFIYMTASGKSLIKSEKFVSKFLDLLPSKSPFARTIWKARLPSENEVIVMPIKVNYVAKSVNIHDTGYRVNGSTHVVSQFLANTWLCYGKGNNGAAYGGYFDIYTGVFSFLSKNDPNLLKTLDLYDGTGDFLRKLEIDDGTLRKAIILALRDDFAVPPDSKGCCCSFLKDYLMGVTTEDRQRRHKEILSTRTSRNLQRHLTRLKTKGLWLQWDHHRMSQKQYGSDLNSSNQ